MSDQIVSTAARLVERLAARPLASKVDSYGSLGILNSGAQYHPYAEGFPTHEELFRESVDFLMQNGREEGAKWLVAATQEVALLKDQRDAEITEEKEKASPLHGVNLSADQLKEVIDKGNEIERDPSHAHIILDKELRRDIDAIIQRLKDAGPKLTFQDLSPAPDDADSEYQPGDFGIKQEPGRYSRERSLAITKLQEAVMWLGCDLKAINEEHPGACENPYPNSKDPSNTTIEPTADGLKL